MTFDALICSLLAGDIFVAGVFCASIAKTVATCDAVKQLQQRSFMIRVGAVYGTDIQRVGCVWKSSAISTRRA